MKLTQNEVKVMHIFWCADRPLSRKDILELNSDKSWHVETIHSLLNSLISKNAIYESGHVKCGRAWRRLYAARYGLDEYCLELLEPVKDIVDHMAFCKQLLVRPGVEVKIIEEIESMIRKHFVDLKE